MKKITPTLKKAVDNALVDWENAKIDLEWALNFIPNETDTLLAAARLSHTESALEDVE